MKDYLYIIGVLYLITAILILFFKNETVKLQSNMKIEPIDFLQIKNLSDLNVQKPNLIKSILEAYKSILKFFTLPHMRILLFILVTIKVFKAMCKLMILSVYTFFDNQLYYYRLVWQQSI